MEKLVLIKNYLILHKKVTLLLSLAFLITVFLYYYLIQPAIFLYSQTKDISLTLKPITSAIKRGDVSSLNYELKYFRKTVVDMKNAAGKIGVFSILPVVGPYASDLSNISRAGLEAYDVVRNLTNFMSPLLPKITFSEGGKNEISSGGVKPSDIASLLPAVSQEIQKYKSQLTSISQKVLKIDEKRYPVEFRGKPIRKYLTYVKSLASLTVNYFDDAAEALKLAPEAVGVGSPKNYLVIIQNDKELRPGGGLLGGYAFIAMQNGNFKLIKSGDISFLDKNVTVQRPRTPDFISQYLGSNALHLRDANYSPDFKESAQNIRKIWLSTSNSFDLEGIIVLDTQFIKSLLETVGPVNLGDGLIVNKDNLEETFGQFFLVIGDQSAQSRKYKDLTSTLLNEILKRVFTYSAYNASDLLSQVERQSQGKHFMVYSTSEGLQKLAEKYNLAGRVSDYTGDYLHINEALLSNRRINWILDENVTKTVSLSNQPPISELTIELTGKSQLTGTENNAVNDLLRIYVPLGSKLLEANGASASVTQKDELGKTVLIAPVKLESGKKVTLIVKYTLPSTTAPDNEYRLLVQKQPGTADYKYKVTINNNSEEFNLSQDKEIIIKP